jgi:hypothetical protein
LDFEKSVASSDEGRNVGDIDAVKLSGHRLTGLKGLASTDISEAHISIADFFDHDAVFLLAGQSNRFANV